MAVVQSDEKQELCRAGSRFMGEFAVSSIFGGWFGGADRLDGQSRRELGGISGMTALLVTMFAFGRAKS